MNGVTSKANIAKSQVFSNSLRNALMLNLLSEWKFDGSGVADGGTATSSYAQDTWGGVSTTIGNTPLVYSGSNCIQGSCLSFSNTTSDYLNFGSATTFDNLSVGFTVSSWANFSSIGSFICDVFGKGYNHAAFNGINLRKAPDDRLFCYVGNGTSITSAQSNSTVAANTWYHIAVSYNGTTVVLYVNGVAQTTTGTIASPIAWYAATKTPSIGVAGGGNMRGKIDEVRIFNAAVPTAEIKELYYAGLNNLLINNSVSGKEYAERMAVAEK
jgi:hypothetical protein